MLAFFIALIAGSTSFFSWWAYQRTAPVALFEDHMEVAGKRIPYEQVINAKIEKNRQPSLVNPSIARREVNLLLIDLH